MEPNRTGRASPGGKFHYEDARIVTFTLVPDLSKTSLRMGISEHPFGTIKRAMGMDHFLLRGLEKVEAEFSLMCLGYNLCRAANLLGFDGLMEIMGGAGTAVLSSVARALRTVVPLWDPLSNGAATGATTC